MKAILDTLSDIPEIQKTEYELRDGKYHLKIEGLPFGYVKSSDLSEANTKLAEFRDNNRALNSTKTELEAKLKTFEGIDPAKYQKDQKKIEDLEKKGIKDGGDVAEIVKNAVAAAVKPLEERETARAASEKAAVERADRELLRSTITAAGMKAGIDDRAVADYVNRGMGIFKIVDGEVVARKGDAPIFSKAKPAEILTVEEWASEELPADAPHLYKPSRGGGAGGNTTGSGNVNKRVISADPLEFGRNLEGIAKGDVIVQQ